MCEARGGGVGCTFYDGSSLGAGPADYEDGLLWCCHFEGKLTFCKNYEKLN